MVQARLERSVQINGWLFVMPALVLLGLFLIYPILWSLWMSFQVGKGLNMSFGGFSNIERLAHDPVFIRALINTCIFFVVQVPIMITLALLLAVALNDSKLLGRGLFRTAIFLPCVTSLVAYSLLFKSMFATDGVVNQALLWLHVIGQPIAWLTDPFWAKIVIILAITWRWTGYNMIFYLAALQNVDRSIYEVARIDGVPARARFTHITVPMLRPVILFTSIISTIGTLQLFDEVNNITLGGPADATLTLSLYIYNLTFKFMPSYGYSATVSYVIVVMVAILAAIQFFVARDRAGRMTARFLSRAALYLALTIAAFISVFPFYWLVVGATNKTSLIIRGKADFGDNLFANAATFFAQIDVPRVLGNSLLISIVGTALTLLISSTAGYGFEIFRSPTRERIFTALLLLLTIPFAAIMVPLFSMIARAGFVNTYTAVIVPTVASIFVIFYFRQATKAFPGELREAARLDGLKEWQIFLFVYFPVMRSTYAAATIIVFMANWNNYLWPLIVLQTDDKKTLTLVVSALTSAYTPDYGAALFAAGLATLPTLIIFFVLQRQFVEGLLGSVK